MNRRDCLGECTFNLMQHSMMIILIGLVFSSTASTGENDFESICFTENALIDVYKAAINNPEAKIDWIKYSDDGLAPDTFRTIDGKIIKGLVWKSDKPKGYLLVAQGTSMLAAEIYERFRMFRDLGLDVYLYDYRGYGESGDIETTLEGMVSDYSTRLKELNSKAKYKGHYIFGISLGGVIFSNAIKKMANHIHGVVFDSVPHAVPWYAFCPSNIDPINLLPVSCERWLIIGAKRDKVIGSRASKLASGAKDQCGAYTKIEQHFGHIFMDDYRNTNERMTAAKEFFGMLVESQINEQ